MESIWVIPRAALFEGHWPQGFIPAAALPLATLEQVVAEHGFATPRERAEATPEWKQPIPYCAVISGTDVLCVERLPKQGEGRLHGKLSLGFGGHVDASDVDGSAGVVQRALDRELGEELGLPPERAARRFLGVINDDSSPVGVVHFGLAFAQWVAEPESVQVRESSKMRGAFRRLVDSDELWQDLQRFESWSRILLEVRALEVLAHPTPRRDSES